MTIVFEKTDKDISELKDVHYLFNHRPSIWDTGEICAQIEAELINCDFNPDADCIALVGDYVATCLLCVVAGAMFGTFTAQIYDVKNRRYVERVVG